MASDFSRDNSIDPIDARLLYLASEPFRDGIAIYPSLKNASATSLDQKSPHRRPFTFLHLPTEIRNMVYRLLLVSSQLAVIISDLIYNRHNGYRQTTFGNYNPLDPARDRMDTGINPSILATNHQINNEAATILYGQNVFSAPDVTKAIREFAYKFGPQNGALVRTLQLDRYTTENGERYRSRSYHESGRMVHAQFDILVTNFTNLNTLKIFNLRPVAVTGGIRLTPDFNKTKYIKEKMGFDKTFDGQQGKTMWIRFTRADGQALEFETQFDMEEVNEAYKESRRIMAIARKAASISAA